MAKIGRKTLTPEAKRDICVSVRLNKSEADRLDELRGSQQRGAWLRQLMNGNAPASIPELNLEAWRELSKAAANLNQIARSINTGADPDPVEVRQILARLRAKLIGAEL